MHFTFSGNSLFTTTPAVVVPCRLKCTNNMKFIYIHGSDALAFAHLCLLFYAGNRNPKGE